MTFQDFFYFKCISEHNYRLGKSAEETFEDFKQCYGALVPELRTISGWYRELPELGTLRVLRLSPGRPRDPTLPMDIASYLEMHPNASVKQIATCLHKAQSTIRDTLRNRLDMEKVSFRYVPHDLSESNKAARVKLASELKSILLNQAETCFRNIVTGDESWIYWKNPPRARSMKRGTPRPTLARRNIGAKKTMLTVFFSGERFWVVDFLPPKLTMTASVFIHRILAPLRAAFDDADDNVGRPLLVHCDNAAPHRSRETVSFLSLNNLIPLNHPPYSPDLSPADFFLFGDLKEHLKGHNFFSQEELEKEVNRYLGDIPREMLQKVFHDWIRCCEEVIGTGGDYIRR
jgi:histone-lysine N-methyltransferase SETMAR